MSVTADRELPPDAQRAAAQAPDAAAAARLAAIHAAVAGIPDPEIPIVTLEDLGILRGVVVEAGAPVVLLTPTYSGCPATEAIAAQVREALDAAGFADARVRTVLSPAWTTDWIGEDARRKLRDYGIAPPACMASGAGWPSGSQQALGPVEAPLRRLPAQGPDTPAPTCPRCGSAEVEQISRWGSTPCKAHYRCVACREPFDYFKPY